MKRYYVLKNQNLAMWDPETKELSIVEPIEKVTALVNDARSGPRVRFGDFGGRDVDDTPEHIQDQGVETEPPERPNPPYRHPLKGRKAGVRHCKKCGEVGHRSDGCPN